jgi:RND family efflux transporter MFP subunit
MNHAGRARAATAALALGALVAACSRERPPTASKPSPAATVAAARPEAELATVTLSPEAVQRLGIRTTAVGARPLAATRTLAGEVAVPDGQTVVVSAPVAGTLTAAGAAQPGDRVEKGAVMFYLQPMASVERDQRIEAERVVSTAQADHDASAQRLQRVERLLTDGAASQRTVEDARAQLAIATAALTAARERLAAVSRSPIGVSGTLPVVAPLTGVLQSVSASGGQTVAASAPLFTVANLDRVWIRVPVYAGDVPTVALNQPIAVGNLSGSGSRPAHPVVAPPRADAAAASVDLVYEMSAGTPPLRPGERVLVEVPLKASENTLAIPDTAIVYDVHGGTWVYEDRGNNSFARRRVSISRHVGNHAVVSEGLAPGARVVDTGAAELFGTEFGTGH